VLLAAPAAASESGISGAWCADNETMWIQETRIGFNDHTLCEVALPIALGEDGAYSTGLNCANVYVLSERADGTLETTEIPLPELTHLTLREQAGELLADFSEQGQLVYARCIWDRQGQDN
jgi:hypothetical protein